MKAKTIGAGTVFGGGGVATLLAGLPPGWAAAAGLAVAVAFLVAGSVQVRWLERQRTRRHELAWQGAAQVSGAGGDAAAVTRALFAAPGPGGDPTGPPP